MAGKIRANVIRSQRTTEKLLGWAVIWRRIESADAVRESAMD
jgi:hypothetical protein